MSQEKFFPALALALPLALFCAGSWIAWRDAERNATERLAAITQAMADEAERAFDANATVLRGRERAPVRGHAVQERRSAIGEPLPHIRAITIRDADGF